MGPCHKVSVCLRSETTTTRLGDSRSDPKDSHRQGFYGAALSSSLGRCGRVSSRAMSPLPRSGNRSARLQFAARELKGVNRCRGARRGRVVRGQPGALADSGRRGNLGRRVPGYVEEAGDAPRTPGSPMIARVLKRLTCRWRKVATNGYVLIKMPGHPRADEKGWLGEHILVAERMLRGPLPPGAVVHHIDGDRANNHPSNLVVFPSRSHHSRLHGYLSRTDPNQVDLWPQDPLELFGALHTAWCEPIRP
jgi:hypothetical protein